MIRPKLEKESGALMTWFLANVVLTFHITLFVVLGAGLFVAAAGHMRPYPQLALAFWLIVAVVTVWLYIPGCALTDLEEWLRHKSQPEWEREATLLRTVIKTASGVRVPGFTDNTIFAFMSGLSFYAFIRYHLADAVAFFRRAGRWLEHRA